MDKVKIKFNEVGNAINNINNLTHSISSNIVFFENNSISVEFDNAQHCFDRLLSWSFGLFIESCKGNISFLLDIFPQYNILIPEEIRNLPVVIQAMRTLRQHSNLSESSQKEKINLYNDWLKKVSKLALENYSPSEWYEACLFLLDSILQYLNLIIFCLKGILSGELKELVAKQWEARALRFFEKYKFDQVLDKVLKNWGLSDFVRINLFMSQNLAQLKKRIDSLADGFDFEKCVTVFIEDILSLQQYMPLRGDELIEAGIPKGIHLGELLKYAKTTFWEAPCSKEELIEKVRSFYKMKFV